MMKRILALLLTGCLALGALAGCGSGSGGSSASTQDSTAQSDASAEAASSEAAPASSTADAAEASSEAAAPAADFNNKVALIFSSVFMDGGGGESAWNTMHEMADLYGLDVSYQENVDDTMVMDVLRNYASEGYGLIVDAEMYHSEQIAEVAPEFPDVKFACLNGYMGKSPNFWSMAADLWQHVYVAGVMAGDVTQTNKIGIITYSTNSDSALTMKTALTEGVHRVNPDAEVIHVATGSFSDLQAGKEMAVSLVGQGCDIIYCNSGDCNETVIQYCSEQGVYSISAVVDRNAMDPEHILGSAVNAPDGMIRTMVGAYAGGTFEGKDAAEVGGIAEGMERFVVNEELPALTQEIRDDMESATAAIAAGEVELVIDKG